MNYLEVIKRQFAGRLIKAYLAKTDVIKSYTAAFILKLLITCLTNKNFSTGRREFQNYSWMRSGWSSCRNLLHVSRFNQSFTTGKIIIYLKIPAKRVSEENNTSVLVRKTGTLMFFKKCIIPTQFYIKISC